MESIYKLVKIIFTVPSFVQKLKKSADCQYETITVIPLPNSFVLFLWVLIILASAIIATNQSFLILHLCYLTQNVLLPIMVAI